MKREWKKTPKITIADLKKMNMSLHLTSNTINS